MGLGPSVVTFRSVKSDRPKKADLTDSVTSDLTDAVRGRGATPLPALPDIDDQGASGQRSWIDGCASRFLDDLSLMAPPCGVVVVLGNQIGSGRSL